MPSVLLCALGACTLIPYVTGAASEGTYRPFLVDTTNGPITGHQAPNGSSVTEFLGIPYAQPPVGDLRFAAPKKYAGHGSYNASDWGFDCPLTASPPANFPGFTPQPQQIIAYFASGAGTPRSEDCLTLNIWAEAARTDDCAPKPVLIFIYGGRFSTGNTNSPFYNAARLADAEGVVVVTLNYRLNIFGFPGAPAATANLGLRDQRLAVEWVRENVAGFGGDPSKLTIFGQSSGGIAIDYWSYAYAKDPIVHGLISESGNALSFPINNAALQERNWYNVSGTVGCGTSGDTIACMRQKNWSIIEAAAAKVPSAPGGSPVRSVPPFYPKVDNETVFTDYVSLSNAGAFARLPYLLGNNANEQGYYIIPAYARGINVTEEQGDDFLLSSFTCPNSFEASNRRKYGVPVWLYRYFGDWDNIRLYPTSGAYHGTELEMIFGNSGAVSGIPLSEAEERMTALMQHAWARFADDPAHGLKEMGWPKFNPASESLIRLAYNNAPKAEFVKPSLYDAPCSTVTFGALQTGATVSSG